MTSLSRRFDDVVKKVEGSRGVLLSISKTDFYQAYVIFRQSSGLKIMIYEREGDILDFELILDF